MPDTPTAQPPARTVLDHVDRAVATAPDDPAVTDVDGTWTWAELHRRSLGVAAWLAHHGARPGDRVIGRLTNRRQLVALLYGALRAGTVFVPLNPAQRPFQFEAVVADADPTVIVVDDAEVGEMTGRPVAGAGEMWTEPDHADPVPSPDPDAIGMLIYTSGSTSAPKGVVSPHRTMAFATEAVADRLGYRRGDRILVAIPLSFDYGLYQVFLAAEAAAGIVLRDPDSPARLGRVLDDEGITVLPVVPSLAEVLVRLSARSGAGAQVRLVTNTGAALNPSSIASLREAFPTAAVVPMFGITECKRVTILEPDGDLDRPGSVGRPLRGTTVTIADPDGKPLPPGEVGEILVAGPHVMAGYWNAPELTAGRFRPGPDGSSVLHTGDFGWVDPDGYLWFVGRRDEVFKRRGVRTSCTEIEAAALDVPGVAAAAVLAPSDDHDLTLFAVTDRDGPEVLREVAERLEDAKVPAACLTLTELPLTPNGKTDKHKLEASLDSVPV